MNSECRSYLRQHIQTFLQKYANSWVFSGEQEYDLTMVDRDRDTLHMFIKYNMEEFNKDG